MAVHKRRRTLGVEGEEIRRRAALSGRVVGAAHTVFEELTKMFRAAARVIRSAHARGGQGATHRVDGVIVQLVKLLRGAAPVADVRLVPHFPIPALDLGLAVFLDAMFGPLENQLGPLGVVLGRISPAGVNLVVLRERGPVMLIRLRLHGKFLGHETDLRIRLHAAREVGVEDAIHNRPVVDGFAIGILAIGPGRTPLQCGRAVARAEQTVGAEINRLRAQSTEFADELLPVLHVGVVRFIRTEETPDGFEFATRLRRVHADDDGEGVGAVGRQGCFGGEKVGTSEQRGDKHGSERETAKEVRVHGGDSLSGHRLET